MTSSVDQLDHSIENIDLSAFEKVDVYHGVSPKDCIRGKIYLYKNIKHSPTKIVSVNNISSKYQLKDVINFMFPHWKCMKELTVLRTSSINCYTLIINFDSEENAELFYMINHGVMYEARDNYELNMAFVKTFDIVDDNNFEVPAQSMQLPSCPICLELLDSCVSGLLTIQCRHSFHRDCLQNWSDSSCPVCRRDQSPLDTGSNICTDCDIRESLWICVICGYIGCDRYFNMHAFDHFKKTAHPFAKQIGSIKVWDYISDSYVHRIISAIDDCKPVEWQSFNKGPSTHEEFMHNKINNIEEENIKLLALQLEENRSFFDKMARKMTLQFNEEMNTLKLHHKEITKANDQKLSDLESSLNILKQKNCKLVKQLEEQQMMCACFSKNQTIYKEIIEKLKKDATMYKTENDELKAQVGDLMAHFACKLEIQQQQEKTGESFVGANISLRSKPKPNKRANKKNQ